MEAKRVCRAGFATGVVVEQQHFDGWVFGGMKVVLAVVAGDRVGLNLDPSAAAVGEVVAAPVGAVVLDEDESQVAADEPDQLADGVCAVP
ncbi:hypothetical protein [Streptomyces lavendulocolor]|uniref:hypothetical protein n=1 Tax=Streptomyces lavendulocolor TaxID=67316 RepID=UPI003C2FC3AB